MSKYAYCLLVAVAMIASQPSQSFAGCGTCDKTVVEAAAHADGFQTLVAAVNASGLADKLSGDGPFTIFAPNDDAFKKLPAEQLAELLEPSNKEKLAGILKYHVLPRKVLAEDVVKLTSAKTAQGSEVGIKVEGGEVMINNAKVVKTDIPCKNGVIHVVDTVILPKS